MSLIKRPKDRKKWGFNNQVCLINRVHLKKQSLRYIGVGSTVAGQLWLPQFLTGTLIIIYSVWLVFTTQLLTTYFITDEIVNE